MIEPTYLPDRYAKSALKSRFPTLYDLLDSEGVLAGKDERVRFSGLAMVGPSETYFFLPHGCQSSDSTAKKLAAISTMGAISRFGRDQLRPGRAVGSDSLDSLAAVLSELAQDFREYGIYSERLHIRGRNSGKPDWSKTVRRELPFFSRSKAPIYSSIRTFLPLRSSDNILASVQAAVIKEIHANHYWWLRREFGDRNPQADVPPPSTRRTLWPSLLKRAMTNLYADRPLRLVRLLLRYLTHSTDASVGRFVCGVQDFSTVWEIMLRNVVPGVEEGWNSRLPAPYYIDASGSRQSNSGMITDFVVRRGDKMIVADAKYYAAQSAATAPGWPDIVKQFYYKKAIETVLPLGTTVETCFVFPSERVSGGPLSKVVMCHSDGASEPNFPTISCTYVPTTSVLDAYRHHKKLPTATVS